MSRLLETEYFSDVVPKDGSQQLKKKRANEEASQPQRLCFGYGVRMIMSNEEVECVHQVVRYINLPALFIQRSNSDFEAQKTDRSKMFTD